MSFAKILLPASVFGFNVMRALVPVQHREIQAVDARNVAKLAAGGIALTRSFNLDDVGSEPRQNLCARRSRLHVRHVQNSNALQGFPHDCLFLEMLT